MITLIKRNPIKLIFAGLFGIVLYLFISGYCFDQMRFLSDEEFIEIAVRDNFNTGRMNIDGSEDSIRTFHAKHPDCCHVFRGKEKGPDWGLEYAGSVIVQVIYEVNEKTFQRTKEKYYEQNSMTGPCGQVSGRDSYGMGREKI